MYEFYSESILYSLPECAISLSDSNGIQTHNQLVHKPAFNRSAKLAKWLSCVAKEFLDIQVNYRVKYPWQNMRNNGVKDT